MATKNDFIEALFNHGVDLRRRRIHFREEVSEESIDYLIKGLLLLEDQNKNPIEVYLSSYGGECYEMFAAFDIIRNLQSHVTIIASGKIMSAASLLLVAGDERKCHINTLFMLHEMSWGIDDEKITTHENYLEHNRIMEKMYYDAFASRTNKSPKQWKLFIKGKQDRYFDAEIALKYGIVDEIIRVE